MLLVAVDIGKTSKVHMSMTVGCCFSVHTCRDLWMCPFHGADGVPGGLTTYADTPVVINYFLHLLVYSGFKAARVDMARYAWDSVIYSDLTARNQYPWLYSAGRQNPVDIISEEHKPKKKTPVEPPPTPNAKTGGNAKIT